MSSVGCPHATLHDASVAPSLPVPEPARFSGSGRADRVTVLHSCEPSVGLARQGSEVAPEGQGLLAGGTAELGGHSLRIERLK